MGNTVSDKKNARTYSLKFSRNTDSDIIQWLDEHKPIQRYIKQLIRQDIAREQKEPASK